jgi:hypothetical protein
VSATLGDVTITGTARRVAYWFDFGEGPVKESAVGGSEAEPAARHTYETKGTYTVTVSSVWTAEVSVVGGPPLDIGRATMTAAVEYPVIEIVPILVG